MEQEEKAEEEEEEYKLIKNTMACACLPFNRNIEIMLRFPYERHTNP
jgi:hypothetical protein